MNQPTPPPEPAVTSPNGGQEKGSSPEALLVNAEPAVAGLPLAQTIQGLASTNARNLGGEVSAQLIAASVVHLSQEVQTLRQDLRATQRELKQANNDLTSEKIKNAALVAHLSGLRRSKHFANAGILIGTLILGVGFDFVRGNQQQILGLGLSLLGVILICVSWFSSPKGDA